MPSVSNPIVDMYQMQLEASRRLADVVFSGTEKIDRVVIEATHRAFTDQLNFAHAIASARDPKGVANLQASFFSRRPDNAVNYQKEIMRVFAEIQNEIGRSVQDYIEQFGSNVASNATAPLKAVQEQANESVFNPVTGMFSVWESAFREVASLANKNMAAARSSFENVANSTVSATADLAQQTTTAASDATRMATEAVTAVDPASSTTGTPNGGGTAGATAATSSVRQAAASVENPGEGAEEKKTSQQQPQSSSHHPSGGKRK